MDAKPGSPPEISVDVNALVFVMRPRGLGTGERLVIRCDEAGDVWIAIVTDDNARHSSRADSPQSQPNG